MQIRRESLFKIISDDRVVSTSLGHTCGIKLTWMLQKFSLFTLNWNCLKASIKGILSMSPTVPPSCWHNARLRGRNRDHPHISAAELTLEVPLSLQKNWFYSAHKNNWRQKSNCLLCDLDLSWLKRLVIENRRLKNECRRWGTRPVQLT